MFLQLFAVTLLLNIFFSSPGRGRVGLTRSGAVVTATAAAAAAAVVQAGVEAVAPAYRLGGLGRRLVLVQLAHGPDEARGSLGTVDADEGGSVPFSD